MLFGLDKNLETLKDLAKADSLPHGFIFYGPEMVGKFTAAKALASYFEKKDWDFEGVLEDAHIIQPDEEGTIGIDAVREIKTFVYQKPNFSKYRTLILDEAERMTEAAENALLKVAEEPPESSLIILIVREPELLSATLRSRFQKIYFGEWNEEDLEEYLKKDKKYPASDAKKLAELSGGKVGLAILLKTDEEFKERMTVALKYLESAPPVRSELIKKLQEDETWNIERFLDDLALALVAKYEGSKGFASAYHALMETRQNFGYYNLSPKIQMEALSQKLELRM
ncbi:MAG: DNA polymerase III, delta prime subunit [Parcubacteria group bacterium LiPW_15]|nr:MAG: DNA polymerase III, delta prime subunit [Parcubacteria group bacterium LiPW_15]